MRHIWITFIAISFIFIVLFVILLSAIYCADFTSIHLILLSIILSSIIKNACANLSSIHLILFSIIFSPNQRLAHPAHHSPLLKDDCTNYSSVQPKILSTSIIKAVCTKYSSVHLIILLSTDLPTIITEARVRSLPHHETQISVQLQFLQKSLLQQSLPASQCP
jgi:hypothetical protein